MKENGKGWSWKKNKRKTNRNQTTQWYAYRKIYQ